MKIKRWTMDIQKFTKKYGEIKNFINSEEQGFQFGDLDPKTGIRFCISTGIVLLTKVTF